MTSTNTTTSDGIDAVSVELPVGRRTLSVLLGLVLLLEGLTQALSLQGHFHDRTYDICNGIATIIFAFLALWHSFATHRVIVSPKELKHETTALGLSTTRYYALWEIESLRIDKQRTFTHGGPWMAFDRNGRRKLIGTQLAEPLPAGLLDPIYARFPQLAPANEA
jgi:hypothetical protein